MNLVPESDETLLSQSRIDVFRSGGPGGQHANVTDSAVRMTHLPTSIVVVSRTERSQFLNRQLCLQRLRQKLAEARRVRKKRVKTKPTRGAKERRLQSKRRHSDRKKQRRKPLDD